MTGLNAYPVADEAEAETLMIHHLRLAAMYFEATGEHMEERLPDDFSNLAMRWWVQAMESLYPDD